MSSISQIDVSVLCVRPLIDGKLRHNIVKVAVSQYTQNGQMLGINEGKRRRKLAVNKDK